MPIKQQLNINVLNIDKVVHALMYSTLSFSWLITVKRIKRKENYFYQLLLIIVLYGIIIEILQETLTASRHGEFKDVLANVFGIIIGAIIFKQISR